MEVVGVGHFQHELAAILAIFFFLLFALPTRTVGLVLALVDDLLNLLFFFISVFALQGVIVFLDQPLHLLAVDLQHFVGLYLRGLYLPFATEPVLFVALDVGVVAETFVVFDVLVR